MLENYRFTKDHQWIQFTDTKAFIGVTAFALEQLGDIVHIDLPPLGKSFQAGETFGTVESTKTVSDLYMPVSGTILEVNSKLLESPETLGDDPYANGWLVKISPTNGSENLLDHQQYQSYIKGS